MRAPFQFTHAISNFTRSFVWCYILKRIFHFVYHSPPSIAISTSFRFDNDTYLNHGASFYLCVLFANCITRFFIFTEQITTLYGCQSTLFGHIDTRLNSYICECLRSSKRVCLFQFYVNIRIYRCGVTTCVHMPYLPNEMNFQFSRATETTKCLRSCSFIHIFIYSHYILAILWTICNLMNESREKWREAVCLCVYRTKKINEQCSYRKYAMHV